MPKDRNVRASASKECRELVGRIWPHNTIHGSGAGENGKPAEVAHDVRGERHHNSEKSRCPQNMRMEKNHAGSNVRPIRVAHGYQGFCAETVAFSGRLNEGREFIRASFQVIDVEHAFTKPAEEPGHAIFEHFASRAEQSGARPQFFSKR